MAASLPMEKDPKQALEVYRQWKDQGTNDSCSIGQLITQRRSAVIYEDFIPICQDLLDFCQLCYKSLTDDCQINSSYYQPRVNKIIQLIEELYRIMLNLCQVEQAILQIQQENSAAAIDLQAVALLKDHKDTDSVPWGIIDEIYHHEIAGKTISLAASTLPPLIDTVSQELSKDVVKKIIETIQRLTWKMEAAVECENGDSPVIHSIIFTPVRQQQLNWAMLPEPSCGSSRQSGLRSSFHLSLPYPTDDISGKGDILTSQPPLLDPNHVANTDGLPDPANLSITSDEKSSNHSKQDTTIQPPSVAIADRSTIVNHDDDDRNRSTDQNETFSDSHQEQIRSCHDVPSATRLQGNNEDLSAHILPCNININKKKSLDKVIDTKELKLPPESEVADPPLSPICHPRIPSIILMKQSSSLDVVQSVSGNGKVSNEFNITSDDIDSNSPTYIHNRTCSFDSVHANHVLTLARDNSMSKVMENNNKLTYRKIGREKYLTLRPLSDVRSSAVMTQEDLTKLGLKVDLLGQVDSQSIDNEINKTTTTLDINTSTVFRQSCADMVQLFSSRKQLSRVNDDVEPPTMKRMSYHSSQELTIPLIIHKDSIESQKEEEKEEEKSQDKEGKKNLQLEISQPQSEESKLPAVDQDMGESPKQLSVSLSDNTDKLIASISQIQENLQVLKQDTPLQLSVTPISVRSMGNFSNILQRALPKKVGQSVFKHRFIVYEIKVTTILPGAQSLSYTIIRKFKQICKLYDKLSKIDHEGPLPSKPIKRFFSKDKQKQLQKVEGILKFVTSNPKLRTSDCVVEFLMPDQQADCSYDEANLEHRASSAVDLYNITHANQKALLNVAASVNMRSPSSSPRQSPIISQRFFTRRGSATPKATTAKENQSVVFKEEDKPTMILTWRKDKYIVAAGTIEKLVEQLACEDSADVGYVKAFLLGYRHFAKPEAVLQMLLSRFNVMLHYDATQEELEYVEKWGLVIRLRTINTLMQWMERCWWDFQGNESMLKHVDDFVETLLVSDAAFHNAAKGIADLKSKKLASGNNSENSSATWYGPSTQSKLTNIKDIKKICIMQVPAQQIAEQLTLIDLEILRSIGPNEVLCHLWGSKSVCRDDKDKAEIAGNLNAYIKRWNTVCYWVGTEICRTLDCRGRAQAMEKFIEIAKHCKIIRNYSTMASIVGGLNIHPIRSLKKSWECVGHKYVKLLNEMEDFMKPDRNYISYRKVLADIPTSCPCIPFFGVFIKDLTFLNDGNPKVLANGLYNFTKIRDISNKINELERYQRSAYQVSPNPKIFFGLKNLQILSEKQIYQQSLKLEQRRKSIH